MGLEPRRSAESRMTICGLQTTLTDGQGLCLFAKRLEKGRFIWPMAATGTVSLSAAQLAMLLEGIDWRAPVRSWHPQLAG
jgi:transposase